MLILKLYRKFKLDPSVHVHMETKKITYAACLSNMFVPLQNIGQNESYGKRALALRV